MGAAELVLMALRLTQVAEGLLATANAVGAIVKRAQEEGREPTEEEVAQARSLDDQARLNLDQAIRDAGG